MTRSLDPERAGCWYTHAGRGWYWTHFNAAEKKVEVGYDPVRLPECEVLFRTVLEDLWITGEEIDLDGVLSARETTVSAMPEVCGSEDYRLAWNLFPQAESRDGCAVEAPTGVMDDTTLVINWEPAFPDAFGGSSCWVYSPEGEWSFYAAADGGG